MSGPCLACESSISVSNIAGPLAAMILADCGADIVPVDPPGGPRWRRASAAAPAGAAPGPLFPMMLHGSPATAIEQAREFMQFGGLPLETELGVIKRLGQIAAASPLRPTTTKE